MTTHLSAKVLAELQGDFFMQFPMGFEDPELAVRIKKHRMDKRLDEAQAFFAKDQLANIHVAADHMVKIVSRSSMVSMFEKPKFRDFVATLNEHDKAYLVHGLQNFLHGNQKAGFEAMVSILQTEKLAKWSLVTIIPAYFAPAEEVFVKPTTAKGILKCFGVSDPVYKPLPTWDFYQKYRDLINEAKEHVDPVLRPSNAAFSGFLMMSVPT